MESRKSPPLPLAQAFVVCRELFEDIQTHEYILIGPFSGVNSAAFPMVFRMSAYAHLTCGHGSYELKLELRDDEGRVQWDCRVPKRIDVDPLRSHRLALRDLPVPFAAPGQYDLVLVANGEDLARHALQARHLSNQR